MKFQLTQALKDYAIKHFGLTAETSEADFRKAIGTNILNGKLTPAVLRELVGVKSVTAPVAPAVPTVAPVAPVVQVPAYSAPAAGPSQEQLLALLDGAINKGVEAALLKHGITNQAPAGITPEAIFSKSAATQVRVKGAAESYQSTRKGAYYPERCGRSGNGTKHLLAGQPAMHAGVTLDHPSDLDKAISSAYFKWCIKSSGQGIQLPSGLRMTDHDEDLLKWSMRNQPWTGMVKGLGVEDGATKINRRKMQEFEIKALLDDSVSGGIEAAPVAFDDAIVLIPILYGELFPLVNVENVARGRRMKGAAMQNPTFTSGVAEGTAITPFNTSAFLTAFDTAIFPAVASMEIGLDFEEDAPMNAGARVIEQYGLQALNYLDRVIAIGDGVTECLGLFNTASSIVVNSDQGAGGPLTVSDYEGLMFGLQKQFRTEAGATPVYVSNDVMYRRARAIPVGPGDERRVFGMTEGSYQILDTPYKVQNDIPNGKLAYVNLRRYRMYRRLGLNVRVETAGRTLALNNTKLIVLRMRYGGQMELGGAVSVCTDSQF